MRFTLPKGLVWRTAVSFAVLLTVAAYVGYRALDRRVDEAAAPAAVARHRVRELSFAPRARPALAAFSVEGDGSVEALVRNGDARWIAGGSGLSRLDETGAEARVSVGEGLPSLRVTAAAAWLGSVAFALERGSWGRLGPAGGVEEATTSWGTLHVRAFAAGEGGDLLVGTREGLFRADPGASELERLADRPVRSIALLPGGRIAAGGENGLFLVTLAGDVRRLRTPDAWVDDVGFDGSRIWAATAKGVAVASLDELERPGGETSAALEGHRRGADVTGGVPVDGAFWGLATGGPPRVVVLRADGTRRELPSPEPFRRLLALDGTLFADGPSGLHQYVAGSGFRLFRRRPASSLPLAHVAALAVSAREVWAGFFEGGLARSAGPRGPWEILEGSDAWGVNALLSSGGAVWAATLRGAYRVDLGGAAAARRLVPVGPEPRGGPAGPGGAFSLASTTSGIAVGYARGVYLPSRRLLSAFHGLPGNQAGALATTRRGESLWVGTPAGVGRIDRQRVSSRAIAGEGKLPHPWVTALLSLPDGRLVAGTYGGGLAVRSADPDGGAWTMTSETAGLKINPGALALLPDGRVAVGTQGKGLYVSDAPVTRFSPLAAAVLPSPDVFALALYPEEGPDSLLVGTNEGLSRIPIDHILSTEPR